MNAIGDALGELCKIILPIRPESYRGNPESAVAVCTLSDIALLEDLASDPGVLRRVNIVGRLLSENRGIDAMLEYLHGNPRVSTVIVCGADGAGHRAGHSLLMLHRYGVDHGNGACCEGGSCNGSNGNNNNNSSSSSSSKPANRISRSRSPEPYTTASPVQIGHFRRNTSIVDMTGTSDRAEILECIGRHCA